MDIQSIFNAGGTVIKNPNYKKGKRNTQPEYITVSDLDSGVAPDGSLVAGIAYDAAAKGQQAILGRNGELDKYINAGFTPNGWENLDKQLADSQSNWTKLGNALVQSIGSEIVLGTFRSIFDIIDFGISSLPGVEKDYQNPISDLIGKGQDYITEDLAPVYVDPDVNIQNGGLTNIGWYAKNIPNIASTLMLLLPAKGFTLGASALLKGTRAGRATTRAIGNARRWATGINKLEDASQMSKWQASINSFTGVSRANKAVEIGAEALLMRTAENYQEARETYLPVYEKASQALNEMTDEDYQKLIDSNPEFFSKDKVDTTNKDEVAKYIARSAADRTFTMDFSNLIFDIVQLYGLRNMGKGIKEVTRTRKIRGLQQESIEAAGEIKPLGAAASSAANSTAKKAAEESLTFFDKVGSYGRRAGGFIYDVGKYQGKTILQESTEGIEEAVNYIAQQEGLTYGKMLLAGQTDDYTNSFWTAIPKTWTNMHGNLGDYLMSPELQESAFWGVAGGWIFGNFGSAANRAQLAIERKAANKLRKENEKTGEQTPLDRITQLFESNEDKVVRMSMQKRLESIGLLQQRLKDIEGGRDPFSEIDKTTNQHAEFTGDVESRKAIARARAISEFRSNLAVDAVNSGTYELLKDYMKSKEVKQAMVNLGLTTKEEVDGFVQETLNDMEDAKADYAKHSAHVLNQVAFINNQNRSKKYKDKDENISDDDIDIPVEYARIIANENYTRSRAVKAIEKQLTTLDVLESEQEAILNELNPDINPIQAKEAVALGALLSTYRTLAAEEREVSENKPNNSLGKLQQFSLLQQIKSQKEAVLKELKNRGIGGNVNSVANIFMAFSVGRRVRKNPDTKKLEDVIETTDAEILDDVRKFFGEELNNVSDESIIQSAKAVNNDLNSILNNNDDGLIKLNNKLFELYTNRTQLEIQKELQRSLIVSSSDQIRERINYYANVQNEVRAKKLSFAEAVIRKAIEDYSGIIDENTGNDLIPAIVAAYNGNKAEARRIAEEVMANPGEGSITASEFLDALDIFAMHRSTNKDLLDWLGETLNMQGKLVHQARTRQIQENATNQNGISATENAKVENSSSKPIETTVGNPTASQSQLANNNPLQQEQQPIENTTARKATGVKLIINNRGKISAANTTNSSQAEISNNVFAGQINEDGSIEISADMLPKNKQLSLIRAGLFDVDEDVDPLSAGEQWKVTENPIVRIRKNKPIEVVKEGRISKVENPGAPATEPAQPQSTPATEPAQSQGASINNEGELIDADSSGVGEGSREASSPEANAVQREKDINEWLQKPTIASELKKCAKGAKNVEEVIQKAIAVSNTEKAKEKLNDILKFDSSKAIVQGYLEEANASTPVAENADSNLPTGEGVRQDGELANIDYDVTIEIFSHIPDLLADNINFDDIHSKVVDSISRKYPTMSREDVEANIKPVIDNVKAASESAKSLKSKALQTGASLAYNARVEDSTTDNFSKPFEAAAEAFLQEYSKLLIVKQIDGKQVVRLEDILRLVQNAYPMSKIEAAAFYNIIRNYLIANQGKYEIIDLNEGEKIFDRLDKTSKQAVEQEYGDEVRVNIRDFIEGGLDEDTIKVLDSLKVGDKVQLSLNKGRVYVSANGKTIGYMSLPSVDGDSYVQRNQGWITDVKVDANGNPVSDVMNIIKDLFLGKGASYDELRTLLTRLSVNPANITEDDIQEFAMNPLIANLARQARLKKQNGNSRTILEVADGGNIDFSAPLLHLVRLWKYTNTSNISTNRDEIEENIAINLYTFYNKLYNNYKALTSLNGGEEAIVSKKSGTHVVRVIEDDTFNSYDQLPLAGDVIVDKENARISIVNMNTTNNITVSGRPAMDKAGFTPGNTFLSMFGTNGEPDFVKAYGVRLSDSAMRSNTAFGKIGSAAFNHFETICHKLFAPTLGIVNSTEELEKFFNALVATENGRNNIPLFRAIRGKFQVEPISYANGSASGIKLVYFEKGKAPIRFFIYNKTQYGKPFAFKVEDGSNSKMITTTRDRSEAQVVREARTALIEFLLPICNINIDMNGIMSDNLNDTNYDGFINRRNGKLIIDIPNEVNPDNAVHEEFDSYNDYLIDNNLIRVNTTKSKNGTNFERFGENQRTNSTLFVSLPKKSEPVTTGITSTIRTEQGTTSENYTAFVDTFTNGKASGKQVVESILTAEDKAKLDEVAGEEGVHFTDLFPQTIEFIPEFNDYDASDINTQHLAATVGNRDRATLTVYKNGVKKKTTRRGANRTFVGPKFANMAASSLKARRYNAIKLLMHERIHNILQSQTDKSKTLLKELEEVYNEFVTLATEDINNGTLSAEDKRILNSLLNVYKKEFAKHKELLAKGNPNTFRHIEEFLVDSMTNGVLNRYLNSKQVENATHNGKPENLLTKIVKAIAKFFGWTSPTDGSLFMKELNIIRDIYGNKNEIITTQTQTEETEETVENDTSKTVEEESESEETIEDEDDLGSALDEDELALINDDEDLSSDDDSVDDEVDWSTVEDLYHGVEVNVDITNSHSLEMQSIKDKAIADGTFMKAPNGNPTNLNERQWLQVRTTAFKNWFGDWEIFNKINPYNTNIKLGNPEADRTSVDADGFGTIIPVYKNESYIGEIAINNTYKHGDFVINGNYVSMSEVGNSVELEEEHRGKGYGKAMYFEFAKQIANKGKILRSATDSSRTPASTRVWESLVRDGYAKRINDRYEIINSSLSEASKVVDENGEPLVVYHSSMNKFTTFDSKHKNRYSETTKNGLKKFFYFTSSKVHAEQFSISDEDILAAKLTEHFYNDVEISELAKGYNISEAEVERLLDKQTVDRGITYEVFLNIRNPLRIDAKRESVSNLSNEEISSINNAEGSIIENALESIDPNVAQMLELDDILENPFTTDYLVKNPNQIKSATSNNGNFSIDDADVYNATVEDAYNNTNNIYDSFIPVGNIDAFGKQLPVEQQAQFAVSVAQGLIKTKCY